MKKNRTLLIALVFTLALALAACAGGGADDAAADAEDANDAEDTEASEETSGVEAQDLTFGAATQGGFWYVLAGAMGEEIQNEIPGSSVAVIEGGSIANVLGVEDGEFHIAFSNGEAIPEALEGIGEFTEKAENIRWMATLYPNPFHIVVRADSGIETVEDLKGKKVSPGIKGYSGEIMFQKVLEHSGMSYDDLGGIEYVGTDDSMNLIRDGHIDAFAGVLAMPASAFQELDSSIGINLVPVPEDVVEAMYAENEGLVPFTIPGGTYTNVEQDTTTVAPFTTMLANKDLDDDLVYELTRIVVENADKWKTLNVSLEDFDAQYSIDNQIGPIHPGAEKYYQDAGVLD